MNQLIKFTLILFAAGFIANACDDDSETNLKTGPYEELVGVYKYNMTGTGTTAIDSESPMQTTVAPVESAFNIMRMPGDTTVQIGTVIYAVSNYTITATYEIDKTVVSSEEKISFTGKVTIIDEGTLKGSTLTMVRSEKGTLSSSTPKKQMARDMLYDIVAEKQ